MGTNGNDAVDSGADELLELLLASERLALSMLQRRQRETQAAYDELRAECYARVKAKQTRVIPKDEFDQQRRDDWNQHGGAKYHALLKNDEKVVIVTQLKVAVLERVVGGVSVPDLPPMLAELIEHARAEEDERRTARR